MKNRVLAAILSVCILTSVPASRNEVSAASKQLNVITYFDTTTTVQYGVPGAFYYRFPAIAEKVADRYEEFGITINFKDINSGSRVTPAEIDNCLRENNNINFDRLCTHLTNAQCNNSSSSSHHTNSSAVMRYARSNYGYDSDETACLFLTCGKICYRTTDNAHLTAKGQNFLWNRFMVVRDYDYTEYNTTLGDTEHINCVSKTLAHEIGHLYNVEDDYLNLHNDSRDYCIWGYYRNLSYIRDNLVICPSCQVIIEDNADAYNHS